MKKDSKNNHFVFFLGLVLFAGFILDIFIWHLVFSVSSSSVPRDYFLDVGQGNASLVSFPNGINVMINAGPIDAVVGEMQNILPQSDDYIDVAIITSPESSEFGGYNFLLDHYRVGAFLYDGRDADASNPAWIVLKQKIQAEHVPLITLGRGDVIHLDNDTINILSPNISFGQSPELNDTALVALVTTLEFKTLFAPDANSNVQNWLIAQHDDLRADVLSASTGDPENFSASPFLRAVNPSAFIVDINDSKSTYDPPSSTSNPIPSSTTTLLTTAQNGTIQLYPSNGRLKIIKEK